ncbi:MAG: polysaccharide deacetylase family protein [Bacteroidota bacterium]
MKLLKMIANTGLSVLALAAATGCNNGPTDKKAADSVSASAKPGPGTPIKYDSSKRYIYLTWDDSPQPPGTVNSKNIFKEENTKVTFFSVGFNQVGPQKRRLIDSIRSGYPQFLLANHSFTHGFRDKYSTFYSPAMTDSAFNDFMKNERELKIPVKIIRLPGNNTWASNGAIDGQKSDNALVKKLDAAGYKIIGWDLEWHQQAKAKAPKESVTEMIQMINQKFDDEATHEMNSIVILSHDRLFEKKEYADSLRRFITELKKDPRNVFETLDHYPTVQKK